MVMALVMVTVGYEGSVCGRQQDEILFSRNNTVKILVVIFVHWDKNTTNMLLTRADKRMNTYLTYITVCDGSDLTGGDGVCLPEPEIHSIRKLS